jgi:DUF438 domain-containing protein
MAYDIEFSDLINLAMDHMGVAITIIAADGKMLYYNNYAEMILDRKPEYIGNEVYSHHQKAASSRKLSSMMKSFQEGRTDPFYYEANPYGKPILVTLSPISSNGEFIGCTQSAQLKEEIMFE